MTEPYSEADTRQELIDQRLWLAGWDVENPARVSQELDILLHEPGSGRPVRERPYQGHQFADYALLLRGRPEAVVEAKKTSRDAQVGQEQARQYAERLRRINGGAQPLILYTNGRKIFYWDAEFYPPSEVFGFPTQDDLEWMVQRRETRSALSTELINTAIAGRDYQIEAVRTLLDAFETQRRRRALMVMATGTGKTRVAVALVDALMRSRWVKRVLFLVDRLALRDQARDAFKEHLPSEPLWPREGDEGFVRDRRVYVCTYPTMQNMIEAGTTPAKWISPFFFDLIVADESHRSIYNAYQQVVKYFHGLTLGLTATPRDHVTHDTFALFDCPPNDPTFAYSYDEAIAHDPPYLCPFEVLKVRSKFQVEGIRGPRLDEPQREQLELEGLDPESIDFEGTDLETKVINSPSNAVIVREFMEECITDPSGTLPGKSIIFAVSISHAWRLQALFDQLYPEHRGRLARVLVSDDSRVHGKGGLLDQFKNRDFPRVAISVDLLDTGVDVLEVVNLVFAKPVFSYVKFWQMIGRGTRVLKADPTQRKPWCTEKDRFLIIDCWGNFENFAMNPRGREPGELVPLPVRLFRARIDKLQTALAVNAEVAPEVIVQLRADLAALPTNNVVVLERSAELARVSGDAFWSRLGDQELGYLRRTIAPILRARSSADFKALRFETDVTDLGTALLVGNRDAVETLREAVLEQVAELPLGVNLVAREADLIRAVLSSVWWSDVTDAKLADLVARLGPLMRFRTQPREPMLALNLADVTAQRERIVVSADGGAIPVAAYKRRVEEAVKALLAENAVLQRLQAGERVGEADLRELAELLRRQDPAIDEEKLRKVYDVRSASFVQLLRHVLGVETLERWSTTVTREFEEYIAAHTTYNALQIRFLQTLREFVLQRGRLERRDLVEAPFTRLHPDGVRGVFPAADIEAMMDFVVRLVA